MKPKAGSFERINEIDKSAARLRKQRERTLITNNRNEREDIATDPWKLNG